MDHDGERAPNDGARGSQRGSREATDRAHDGERAPNDGARQAQRDPGLSRERTWLAWWRTLLVAVGVAVLTARLAATEDAPLIVAAALAGWTALFAVAFRRYRSRRAGPGPALPLFALLIVGYAALGTLLVMNR
jgi:Flp pilus assembly protein TadB